VDGLCQLYWARSSTTENYSIVSHDPVGSCLLNDIESAMFIAYGLFSVLSGRSFEASAHRCVTPSPVHVK